MYLYLQLFWTKPQQILLKDHDGYDNHQHPTAHTLEIINCQSTTYFMNTQCSDQHIYF